MGIGKGITGYAAFGETAAMGGEPLFVDLAERHVQTLGDGSIGQTGKGLFCFIACGVVADVHSGFLGLPGFGTGAGVLVDGSHAVGSLAAFALGFLFFSTIRAIERPLRKCRR